jgi:hypothetical protein
MATAAEATTAVPPESFGASATHTKKKKKKQKAAPETYPQRTRFINNTGVDVRLYDRKEAFKRRENPRRGPFSSTPAGSGAHRSWAKLLLDHSHDLVETGLPRLGAIYILGGRLGGV